MRVTEQQVSYLQLVTDNTVSIADKFRAQNKAGQLSLFPVNNDDFLIFLGMRGVSGRGFSDFLEEVRPRVVWDLRIVPEFSFSGMSREKFFHIKSKLNLLYRDLGGDVDASIFDEKKLDFLQRSIVKVCDKGGPYLFLFDQYRFEFLYIDAIFSFMKSKKMIKEIFVNS
jgi:hypothetical protein